MVTLCRLPSLLRTATILLSLKVPQRRLQPWIFSHPSCLGFLSASYHFAQGESCLTDCTHSWGPHMMINRSETSATRRLLQCTGFCLSMNDISAKFAGPHAQTPDLSYVEFMSRTTVIDQVARWCISGRPGRSRPKWTPVLYRYEVRPLHRLGEVLLILSARRWPTALLGVR